jgi:NCS1 family nucleobase:cation symporter-1
MAAGENPDPNGIRTVVLDTETIRSSSLYNEDLAPIPASRRTWSTYNYAALWIAMSINIPTYMLA